MIAARSLLAVAAMGSVLVAAAPARAELATWDQSKVTELAKRFAEATNELDDTFYKLPPPTRGSMQSRAYAQLRQKVRALRVEAGSLAGDLAKGEGYEETLPSYDSLMELVRDARRNSQRVFTTTDVQQKATAARLILNQLTPYYDPDAEPLGPAAR
jgi:hypothetical protein